MNLSFLIESISKNILNKVIKRFKFGCNHFSTIMFRQLSHHGFVVVLGAPNLGSSLSCLSTNSIKMCKRYWSFSVSSLNRKEMLLILDLHYRAVDIHSSLTYLGWQLTTLPTYGTMKNDNYFLEIWLRIVLLSL